jgi:hypothetical protein
MSNMQISLKLDVGIGNFGRSAMSVSAEICLRLSKLTDDEEKKIAYIENGFNLANLAISGCDGKNGTAKNITAFLQIEPVYRELNQLMESRRSNDKPDDKC